MLNQRKVADLDIAWQIDGAGIAGTLRLEDETLRLTDIGAVYFRLMDDRILPELEGEPEGSPARRHARGFHDALLRWLKVAPDASSTAPSRKAPTAPSPTRRSSSSTTACACRRR
jgi:hypothetical protein